MSFFPSLTHSVLPSLLCLLTAASCYLLYARIINESLNESLLLVPDLKISIDDDDDDDEAHLTEPSRPLQGEHEAFPGAEVLFVAQLRALVAMVIVLPVSFLGGGVVRQLQQEQNCRTQTEQQGQHRAPHLNDPNCTDQTPNRDQWNQRTFTQVLHLVLICTVTPRHLSDGHTYFWNVRFYVK